MTNLQQKKEDSIFIIVINYDSLYRPLQYSQEIILYFPSKWYKLCLCVLNLYLIKSVTEVKPLIPTIDAFQTIQTNNTRVGLNRMFRVIISLWELDEYANGVDSLYTQMCGVSN